MFMPNLLLYMYIGTMCMYIQIHVIYCATHFLLFLWRSPVHPASQVSSGALWPQLLLLPILPPSPCLLCHLVMFSCNGHSRQANFFHSEGMVAWHRPWWLLRDVVCDIFAISRGVGPGWSPTCTWHSDYRGVHRISPLHPTVIQRRGTYTHVWIWYQWAEISMDGMVPW